MLFPREIHIHNHLDSERNKLERLLQTVVSHTERIMATQKELADKLNALGAQLTKVDGEVQAVKQKVIDLQTVIDNGPPVSDELQAAVDAVTAGVQKIDDELPDAPTP